MKTSSIIEPLEARIAPAAMFVNANTATYTDVDGDEVTVTFSNPILTLLNADDVVKTNSASTGPQQLLKIDLTLVGAAADGTDITVSAVKAATGDGLVNVGYINATDIDLGDVTVKGDLCTIDAGDMTTADDPAMKTLSVQSMGTFGLATGAPDFISDIKGALGALNVKGDVRDSFIHVTAAADADATIGSVTIGGSLVGAISPGVNDRPGSIESTGDIGPVKIGHDVQGFGYASGFIQSDRGKIASVTLGGSLIGGYGQFSGEIRSGGDLGPVKIAGNVKGGLGPQSGFIASDTGFGVDNGKIASITINGSLIGGVGAQSGFIRSSSDLGAVKIVHDVRAGTGAESAKIVSGGKLASLTVGGSVFGGGGTYESAGLDDAQIFSTLDMGAVKIARDLIGSGGKFSGQILSGGKLASATIGGSIVGSGGEGSGAIVASGETGLVKVAHDLRGGAGKNSGIVFSTGAIAGLTIGGSLVGGSGEASGSTDSPIRAVKIARNLEGGAGLRSGVVNLAQVVTVGGSLIGGVGDGGGAIRGASIDSITIGHDVIGGTAPNGSGFIGAQLIDRVTIGGSLLGGTGNSSGSITTMGGMETITIGGDIRGGSVSGMDSLNRSGYIGASSGRIGSLTVGGSIFAGIDNSTGALTNNASIRAGNDIGSLTIHGDVVGNSNANGTTPVVISARGRSSLLAGATTDVAIDRITIGGRAEFVNILAGYDTNLTPRNADAQIVAVKVGADWFASNVVAGAMNLGTDDAPMGTGTAADNVNYGDAHDLKTSGPGTIDDTEIDSKIGSITIGGQLFGSPETFLPDDHFGIVAEQIGAFKVGARTFNLPGASNTDIVKLGFAPLVADRDINLHETLAVMPATVTNAVPSATRLDTSTIAYTDFDGDHVKVKLTKPLLTSDTIANLVFTFDQGTVGGPNAFPQQLQRIDLAALGTNGVGVTITVAPGGGDGLANVGIITLGNFNAGAIAIPGDLGGVRGGGNTAGTLAIPALSVRSFGRLGLDTEPPMSGTFTPALGGEVNGGIGTLTVKQDNFGALLDISGPIDLVTVGGSLVAGLAGSVGLISATEDIGAVKIGGNIEGGTGFFSGTILAVKSIASVTVDGSLVGGTNDFSGQIRAVTGTGETGTLGAVKIGGNILGGLGGHSGRIASGDFNVATPPPGKITSVTVGGSLIGNGPVSARIDSTGDMGMVKIASEVEARADGSGVIDSGPGKLAGVSIGGSLTGGGDLSGLIQSDGDMGPVKIAHNLRGSDGLNSLVGAITSNAKIASVTIGGSVLGGSNDSSGLIASVGDLGPVKIGGDLAGGDAFGGGSGSGSGSISAGSPSGLPPVVGTIASVTIGGSVFGGHGSGSGSIGANGEIGAVRIGGNVLGAFGSNSGRIATEGKLASLTIGGSLVGGEHVSAGEISAVVGTGPIKISHDLAGGTGNSTGHISASNVIASIDIRGSLVGGTNLSDVALIGTGLIETSNSIGKIRIGHDLIGGSIPDVMFATEGDLLFSGAIKSNNRIGSVTIGGSMIAGSDLSSSGSILNSASIRVTADIGSLTVKGNIAGSTSTSGNALILITAGREPTLLPSFGKITIGGRVERANILAGFDSNTPPIARNANAQIGAVTVGGSWFASNLIAGAENWGANNTPDDSDDNINFGDGRDHVIDNLAGSVAKIASITIKGVVAGTAAPGDHFGFVSHSIGSFKSAGFTGPLAGDGEGFELAPLTNDVNVAEVPLHP